VQRYVLRARIVSTGAPRRRHTLQKTLRSPLGVIWAAATLVAEGAANESLVTAGPYRAYSSHSLSESRAANRDLDLCFVPFVNVHLYNLGWFGSAFERLKESS
jgi:hypothetical protein